MRCNKCAAESEVLETRKSAPWVRRTRLCFNGHKFVTYEVYAGNIDKGTKQGTNRHLVAVSTANHRRVRVMNSPSKTATQLAKELGITEARVRQIRKELL